MSRYDDRDELYVREEVRRFKQHLLTYAVVVGALFLINMMSGGFWDGDWWFLWVAVFWGIAIAFQAARLFGDDVGREWEERTVDRILARRRRRAAPSEPRAPRPAPPPPPPRKPYSPPPPPDPFGEPRPSAAPEAAAPSAPEPPPPAPPPPRAPEASAAEPSAAEAAPAEGAAAVIITPAPSEAAPEAAPPGPEDGAAAPGEPKQS